MAFLTRYDEDTAAPSAKEAARDVALRALAPMVVWWVLVVAGGWLLTDGPLRSLGRSEEGVNDWFARRRDGTWNDITWLFSWVGATASIIGVCLVVVAVLWWRTRRWWFAVVPLIAISLQALVFFFATLVIDRHRPSVSKLDDSPPTSSYPSGHTGAATALYFTLALLALRIRQPVLRTVTVVVCVLVPFLVATARLYRGMHHVTDVSVAMLNGLLAVLLAWGWLRRDDADGERSARAVRSDEQGREPQTLA
jgi:undecaprenyl-diphosphatase